jgi:hypothetical protein
MAEEYTGDDEPIEEVVEAQSEGEDFYDENDEMQMDYDDEIRDEDIDFLEKYCLSKDRIQATARAFDNDSFFHWYWSLLNAQVRNDPEEREKWEKDIADKDFFNMISVQQLLLRQEVIECTPETIEDVQSKLQEVIENVNLDHVVDGTVGAKDEKAFPTELQVRTNDLLNRNFTKVQNGEDSIQNTFTAASGLWLADKIERKGLDAAQMGDLLDLMEDEPPKIPFLLTALQADFKNGTLFGERKLHSKLTCETMMRLADKMPKLFEQEAFAVACLQKLRDVSDVSLLDNRKKLGEYYKKMLKFVKARSIPHVSLQALVIFNFMRFQEEEGNGYDENLVKGYLALPRRGNIYKPLPKPKKKKRRNEKVVVHKEPEGDQTQVLQVDFTVESIPELKPIAYEELYIQRALSSFFLKKRKVDDFEKVLAKSYSVPLRAEVMLMAGKGSEKSRDEMINQIKSARGPGAYKELKDRVDLEFVPSSRKAYSVEDGIYMEILSKNNPSIDVNVYRVNAKNYYKTMKQEIPDDITLSGSMPIVSYNISSEDVKPINKVKHKINIPQLEGERGVFAVDITGNGVYLRVLIRKGELRYIADQDSNSNRGHVFKVFNEKNELVKDPCIWMDGEEYYADENGDVCLPFCQGESRAELIILEDATTMGTATLQQFQRMAPKYKLECGMYIDREQLRNKEEASVLIRANIYFNTQIISLARLENVQFKLVCEDNMGKIRTRISSLELLDEQETVYEFTVPTELRYVECILTCQCEGVDLVSKQLLNVNTLNDTMAMGDMYLYPSGGAGYVLAVFGKNGEVFPGQTVELQFTHRFLREPVKRMVQTDENGLVYLGKCYDVTQIDATSVADSTTFSDKVYSEQSFDVLKDMVNLPQVVNRNLGDVVRIPFIADNPRKPPSIYVYDKDYISDFSANAKYEGYYITIEGLPAGDFICHIRDVQNADINICISTGLTLDTGLGSYVISENRVLGISEDMPLNIIDVIGNRKEGYTVKLQGVNELTRVHLVAVVNVPAFNLFGFLSSPNAPPTYIEFEQPVSAYLPATALASEYNYIINRKSSPQSFGNLLPRPTLAAHLWSAQNAPIRTKDPKKYVADREVINKMKSKYAANLDNFGVAAKRKEGDSTSLEFLGVSSKVIFNIRPEIDGDVATISIPKDFYSHEHNLVQVLAVDDDNTALRNVILEEHVDPIQRTDVRLNPGLDSSKHYAETRKVVCLRSPGDEYIIEDFSTAEYEPYEALDEPYNLYRAVGTKREVFVQFEPLVHWHEISDEEKLEFYDCYACNEVNLFLFNKDRDFFDKVCVSVIQNKTQKTFMDDYVLGVELKKYTKLNRFSKLNVLEKILLCYTLEDPDFSAKTLAWIREKAELTDIDPRNMDKLFNMGIDSVQLGVQELDKQMLKAEKSARNIQTLSTDGDLVEKITSLDAIRKSGIFGGSEEYMSMTRQYAEATYYGVDSQSQTADLISPNRFWADYGSFLLEKLPGGFVSEWFQIATSSLNEMLLALAVLDVPLFAEAPEKVIEGNGVVKVVATNPVILYLRELIETERTTSAVNVSTNYFDPTQIKHVVDGEMQDKFIEQFTTGRVFGCSVVVTNVSSVPQQVEVLCQVPTGSIPCGVQCFQTQCYLQDLPPFGTYRREFYFYWPSPGTFSHFPPHVNKNGKTIGSGGGLDKIEVTVEEVEKDTTSWKYISNIAEDDDVLDFLENSAEAADVSLERICWRCKEPAFFMKAVNILRQRRIYNDQIWAYSLISDKEGKALGEFLAQNAEFRDYCGPALSGDLTTIDLEAVRDWQVMEFWPLLNPRTHSFAMDYQEFKYYYNDFLNLIAFTSSSVQEISVKDKLIFASYLLVRNKVDEAKKLFDGINPEDTAAHKIIYDYFDVYFAYMMNETKKAAKISESYVDRNMPNFMKQKFQDVLNAIAESKDPTLSDAIFLEEEERFRQEQMKPYVSFEVVDGKINIEYRNIEGATVNFYKTELEILFSAHPFQESNTGYKLVQPNDSIVLMDLDPNSNSKEIRLPEDYQEQNTIIQIITDTLEVVDLYNDHNLDIHLAEDEGELRVLDSETGRPVEGAYCKVYGQSRINPEEAEFFKDGYTDLRGRFDYRALSTDQLCQVSKLSILIQTEERGSLIKECDVPLSVPLP